MACAQERDDVYTMGLLSHGQAADFGVWRETCSKMTVLARTWAVQGRHSLRLRLSRSLP